MTTFATIDEVQHSVLQSLLQSGAEVTPRGLRTRELQAVQFTLIDPRARCLANPIRKWSMPIAVGEFAWHASAGRDLEHLTYYLPRWADFSDDRCNVRGSCYGWRIFRSRPRVGSQWSRVIELLRADPVSRRAVLTMHSPARVLSATEKDSPCALTLQFMVRNGRLDAIGVMRSNDAIWGLPYDVFLFTMFQELLAAELNIEVGLYTHFAGSMHLYERHFGLAERIVQSPIAPSSVMPPLDHPRQLPLFLAYERWLRTPITKQPDIRLLSSYWTGLTKLLENYAAAHRTVSAV